MTNNSSISTNTDIPNLNLLSPIRVGDMELEHRIVMAPMTRQRTQPTEFIPNNDMVEYYSQRASVGAFLITEAAMISPNASGYWGAAGIYSEEQIAGWIKVTDAVHAKGAKIYIQLWHTGRVSHVSMQPDGISPVAPSAVAHDSVADTPTGYQTASYARALETEEIPLIVEDFRKAAENALKAGFDGVELHGANGYLIDQFLQDNANLRTDIYGGSLENRTRFPLQVIEALITVWGSKKVGVRISPSGVANDMHDSNPRALFEYFTVQLNQYDLAYLHIIEPRVVANDEPVEGMEAVASKKLRPIYKGTIIAAGGFNRDSAEAILQSGDADLVAFGRAYVSNPDLVRRLRDGLLLTKPDRGTFYTGGIKGYIDYPAYEDSAS